MKKHVVLFLLAIASSLHIHPSDGTVDPSFAGTGSSVNPTLSNALAATVQVDGKIVIVGPDSTFINLDLMRLNPDGSLDTSFGGGVVQTNLVISNNFTQVLVQPDGKILVCGTDIPTSNAAIQRFNTNGSPDTTFGSSNGELLYPTGAQFMDLALQSNGEIIAVGQDNGSNTLAVRFQSNGTFDIQFPTVEANSYLRSVLVQGDGSIVATINGASLALVRYTANGTLDPSFGGGSGIAFGQAGTAAAVAIQSDGKLIVAGTESVSGSLSFIAGRFNTNGTLDTSYVLSPQFGPLEGTCNALVIQPDNKAILIGTATTGSHLLIARFTTSGALDTTTFGISGIITTPGITASGGALQSNGYLIVANQVVPLDLNAAQVTRYINSPSFIATAITSPSNNTTITPGTVLFSGQAQSLSIVFLLLNGAVTAGTYTDPNSWNITTAITNPGKYLAQVVSIYQSGRLNISSPSITLTNGPVSPINATATIIENIFLSRAEFVLQGTFGPSTTAGVSEYVVLQNGIVIATISAQGPFTFTICMPKLTSFNNIGIAAVANGAVGPVAPIIIT